MLVGFNLTNNNKCDIIKRNVVGNMKMIFTKASNKSIIGITGRLAFHPHLFDFSGLHIFIRKHSFYLLGFGEQIKHRVLYLKIKREPKHIKNLIIVDIYWNWLYNFIIRRTK